MCAFDMQEAGAAVVLSESEKLRLEQLLAQDDEHIVKGLLYSASTYG